MAKYVYPAIFKEEESGLYSVDFPDFESCYTQGENPQDAVENARDVLCFTLYSIENKDGQIPAPTDVRKVQCEGNAFVSLIDCDTIEYRRLNDSKAVKKTLTIPNWLNTLSEKAGINFSAVLQKALMQELKIENN